MKKPCVFSLERSFAARAPNSKVYRNKVLRVYKAMSSDTITTGSIWLSIANYENRKFEQLLII
jgi:hypothetical protein